MTAPCQSVNVGRCLTQAKAPLRVNPGSLGVRDVEVRLSPDLQAKLDHWTAETGRSADELVADAMAGYFEELAQLQGMLNSRYDDLKSGRVQPIEETEALAHLRKISEKRRSKLHG